MSIEVHGILTPTRFGAVGDGVADDSDALDEFFLAAESVPRGTLLDWSKVYAVSRAITVRGRQPHRPGLVRTIGNISGPVVILDADQAAFYGRLEIEAFDAGGSGTFYSSRRCDVGMRVRRGEGTKFVGGLRIEGARKHGVDFELGSVAHRLDMGEVFAVSCGSAPYAGNPSIEVSVDFDGRVDTSTSGNVSQRSVLTCSPHADWDVGSVLFFEDQGVAEPYQIVAIGTNNVEVFPWLPIGVTDGTLRSAHGFGVAATGSNNSNMQVKVNAIRCGGALLCGSLYGLDAEVVVHGSGFGVQLASDGSDRSLGNHVRRFYAEGGDVKWHVIQSGRNHDEDTFTGCSALDLNKIFVMAPRLSTGAYHYAWKRPKFSIDRGHEVLRPGPALIGNQDRLLATNAPADNDITVTRSSPTIKVDWHPEYDQWGWQRAWIEARSPTGGSPGTVTLQPAVGDPFGLIEGSTSHQVVVNGPVVIRLIRNVATSNWMVAYWEGSC